MKGGSTRLWPLVLVSVIALIPAAEVHAQQQCVPPPSALVSWWPGDGNANDIAGGNPGTLVNGATFGTGQVGQAFALDGVNDFVHFGTEVGNFGTADFTVDLWVKFNNLAGEQVLIEKYIETLSGSRTGWGITKLPGQTLLLYGPTGSSVVIPAVSPPGGLATNTWYHIAATRTGNTFRLYFNGVLIASAMPATLNLNSTSSLKIGHRGNPIDTPGSQDTRGFFLNGLIDEVEVFSRALDPQEIQDIYSAGSAGKCKNQAPVANAGPDQTVHPGAAVSLTGNQSADPDGHTPLTFAWSIAEAPAGSLAELDDPTSVTPSFTPDVLGTYRIRLVVTDALGLPSEPDEVVVSTENSAPAAHAGADQQVIQLGTLVQLDGGQSIDDDGDTITYAWSLDQTPAGSGASLSDPTAVTPTFVADVQGEYRASLIVTDEFGAASVADEVVVSFLNVAPVADAGKNQVVPVGTTVHLEGGGSSDANLDPLTYQWSLASRPAGSLAALTGEATATPTLVPDLPGTYTVSLVVHDGQVASAPDVVTIQATADTGNIVAKLTEAIDAVNALAPGTLKNANMQKALTNKLAAVIADVEAGRLQEALDKLEHDVIAKTDGCAAAGAPDKNDWLKTCDAQGPVYALLRSAADLLRAALF